jgi:hypothetical protein
VLRAFRTHGWTYTEQRSGRWHYLILRGHDQSAAYKLIGPLFDETGGYYQVTGSPDHLDIGTKKAPAMTTADGWPTAAWASDAARVDDAALPPVLHPLLAARWSPTTFDLSYEVTAAEVDAILEAARWAPSAGNSQPWAFITGRRSDPIHARLTRHLTGSSAAWAPSASLLVANLCHRYVEGTDWEYSEFADYDLGQAVAHTLQAQALGLTPGSSGPQPHCSGDRVHGATALGNHDDERIPTTTARPYSRTGSH